MRVRCNLGSAEVKGNLAIGFKRDRISPLAAFLAQAHLQISLLSSCVIIYFASVKSHWPSLPPSNKENQNVFGPFHDSCVYLDWYVPLHHNECNCFIKLDRNTMQYSCRCFFRLLLNYHCGGDRHLNALILVAFSFLSTTVKEEASNRGKYWTQVLIDPWKTSS